MQSLSPEEEALWARVASTIRPLSREKKEPHDSTVTSAPRLAPKLGSPLRSVHQPDKQVTPGTTLDGSWDKRLRSGSMMPDRILDLHGMTLDSAWRAIDSALDQAIARGDRLLLLITGHQRSGEPPIRRGAIRAAVHDWLAASRHAADIAAVRGAHGRHGGDGSLYIVLRRRRGPR